MAGNHGNQPHVLTLAGDGGANKGTPTRMESIGVVLDEPSDNIPAADRRTISSRQLTGVIKPQSTEVPKLAMSCHLTYRAHDDAVTFIAFSPWWVLLPH